MKTRTSLLLAFVLILITAAAGTSSATPPASSCLMNPPPNCDFDPVCTSNCSVLYPKDAEARCECSLGCCMPIG